MTSNFWKILPLSLLLCWIGIPPGLADVVVPISVSQQVSVSGVVNACDPFCQAVSNVQDNGSSFSSANANILLPPKSSLSQDGSATDSVPLTFAGVTYYVRTAQVDASAGQTSTLSPTNFNLGLFVSEDFSGNDTLMDGSVSADSQYSLVFDLTSPYVVHLTGGISGESSSDYGAGFFYGSFDGQIQLTGPGVQFDQALSFPYDTFDEVFILGPGQYTLAAVSGLNGEDEYYLDSNSYVDVSLNADFTPAVPEPAQVSTFLGVLMMVGLFFYRRHAVAGFR